jgi:hypothetical protein
MLLLLLRSAAGVIDPPVDPPVEQIKGGVGRPQRRDAYVVFQDEDQPDPVVTKSAPKKEPEVIAAKPEPKAPDWTAELLLLMAA